MLAAAAPGQARDAGPPSPEAAVSRFVALNNIRALQSDEAEGLLAGEFSRLRLQGGGDLPEADKVLVITEAKAVARLPAREGGNPDLYLYLERAPGGWRLVAWRTLALTGLLAELRRQLQLLRDRTPDQEEALRHTQLVLAPDRTLLAWAMEHRALLDRCRAEPGSPAVARALKAAGGNGIRVEDGITFVSIGGILDNEVGFLFAPEGRLPGIDQSHYIWIEPAREGWYLFKTT
jgi:hypothetical protein